MKKSSERKEALWRVVVLIISGIILYFWSYLSGVLVLINWLVALIAGYRHRGIAEFVEYWNTEVYKFSRYISGVSNVKPFPFTDVERMSKFEK